MGIFLVFCRIVLGVVFGLAAASKLADRRGTQRAVAAFGVPQTLADPIGLFLPLVELCTALLLLFLPSAFWGSLAALILLGAFVIAISVNLARGKRPDCHCFGQLHSEPVGWKTLSRNAFLSVGACLLIWRGDTSGANVLSFTSEFLHSFPVGITGLLVVVGLLFLVQTWFMFHLLRQQGRLMIRLDVLESDAKQAESVPAIHPGLPIGTNAPSFEIPNLAGESTSLKKLCDLGKPVILIFSDPRCNPCNALLPDIARWEADLSADPNGMTFALVSRGSVEANRSKMLGYRLGNVLLQQDREVAEMYYAQGTPSAVLVNLGGTIGSPVVMGSVAITHLVTHAFGNARQPSLTRNEEIKVVNAHETLVGKKAPSFVLPDLDGRMTSFSNCLGQDTLVLFWSPSCRFCKSMLPDLRHWLQNRSSGAPELLVISTGPVELNREMGIHSTILLDQNLAIGNLFGASGTPSAILVNSEGVIKSDVSVGAAAVFKLATAATITPTVNRLAATGS